MPVTSGDLHLRFRSLLPGRWFNDKAPVLDSVIEALTTGWAFIFSLIDFLNLQTRIHSSTSGWIDLAAKDFFGSRLTRRTRETDESFKKRILFELAKDRCTRAAVSQTLMTFTGRRPVIFEPSMPGDTGCYGIRSGDQQGTIGYGTSGGWGSLVLPYQAFVTAYRPPSHGVAFVNGWGNEGAAYGAGLSAYTKPDLDWPITDTDIALEIAHVAPAASVIWLSISP
jgi:hypothetical protein